MEKTFKVIMLATDEKANVEDIVMSKFKDIHVVTKNDGKEYLKTTTKQHLYIISDDCIYVGDWYLDLSMKTSDYGVHKCDSERLKEVTYKFKSTAKKIIATTNKSLIIHKEIAGSDKDSNNNWGIQEHMVLPKLPDTFIEKYINYYNSGKQIMEISAKTHYVPGGNTEKEGIFERGYGDQILTDDNNEIIIL